MKLSLLFETDEDNRRLEQALAGGDVDAYYALLRKMMRNEYDSEKIKPNPFRKLKGKKLGQKPMWRHPGQTQDLFYVSIEWHPDEQNMQEAIIETLKELDQQGYNPSDWEMVDNDEEEGWAALNIELNDQYLQDLLEHQYLRFMSKGNYPVRIGSNWI